MPQMLSQESKVIPHAAVLPAVPIQIRRVRFIAEPACGDVVLAEFNEPYRRYAVAEFLDLEDLTRLGAETDPAQELYVVFLASGSASPLSWRRLAEQWIAKPPGKGQEETIELLIQSDRVLWRPGKALVIGAVERLEDVLSGMLDFAFHEGQLRRLERTIDADWETVEADIPLTHQVRKAELKRWPHVNRMTEMVTAYRIEYIRLERRLEKASLLLPPSGRRLVYELAVQTEVIERLRAVDDKLEVFEDLYELANDRLSEFSYFIREYCLELGIIAVLFLDTLLTILDMVVR